MTTDASQFRIAMTTCGAEDDAQRIARAALEARAAACVQIFPIRSMYMWEGQARDDREWMLLLKTRRQAWDLLEATIRSVHPYQVPEIVAVDLAAGHAPYLDWMIGEMTTPSSG